MMPMTKARAQNFCGVGLLFCLTVIGNHLALGEGGGAHNHRSRVSMLSEIAPGISFVKTPSPGSEGRENFRKTRDGHYTAYTVSDGTERLFVEDRAGRVVYEVRGIPLDYRPLSDLKWSGRNRLVFDRWSQPHHGVHYELDVRRKVVVAVYAFPG